MCCSILPNPTWHPDHINRGAAQGASGNPVGLLRPHFSPNHDLFDQFYTAGFYGTKRMIEILSEQHLISHKFSGLLQLLTNQRLEQKYTQIQNKRGLSPAQLQTHTPGQLNKYFNIISQHGGILLPEAGVVCPVDLCHALTQLPTLTLYTQQQVTRLTHDDDHWHITTKQGDHLTATHIVLATATHTTTLPLCAGYPLSESAGQLTLVPEQMGMPNCSLSYEGYLTPALTGWHALGASFRPHGANTMVDPLEQEKNLNQLAIVCPNLASGIELDHCQARVSVRAVTPDHLPLVGPIDHYADFNQRWFKFAKGYQRHTPTSQPIPNAYLISGFGAKGLASCWLSAEIIASLIDNTPLPISNTLYKALYPARFWLRAQQKSSYTPPSNKK